jgi:hypothetical protein
MRVRLGLLRVGIGLAVPVIFDKLEFDDIAAGLLRDHIELDVSITLGAAGMLDLRVVTEAWLDDGAPYSPTYALMYVPPGVLFYLQSGRRMLWVPRMGRAVSNYRHARLFFSPYSIISHHPGSRKRQSSILRCFEVCSRHKPRARNMSRAQRGSGIPMAPLTEN